MVFDVKIASCPGGVAHVWSRKMENDPEKIIGHQARRLTPEEVAKLESDTELISEFRQRKLEKDAKKNWDLFYKRNEDRFFRNRNWTTREFVELLDDDVGDPNNDDEMKSLLEVGCGVGNFVWPLLESGLRFRFYACDFSPVAVDLFKKNPSYNPERCQVFQADITEPDGILSKQPDTDIRYDFVALIFVLSAIHPEKMKMALRNIVQVLKPDGVLIFRDYGQYDYSMIRYSPGHKMAENFYVRQDGTRTFYHSIESMEILAKESGLETLQLDYVQRETVNLKEGLSVPRIFIQGKFRKKKEES